MQLELLKLFRYKLSDHQLTEIKTLLAKYFADAATKGMDELWEKNNWDNLTIENLSKEHLRKL